MKIYNIFGRPEEREPIHMSEVLAAADARPVLPAPSATARLQRNLERTGTESTARAEVLRQEIAAREAELADVLRADEAARVALDNLTETGHVPYAEEPVMTWPFGRAGDFSPITDEDLSAACGLALEAELQEGDEDDIDPPGKPATRWA